jgi:hypothetical protein
MPVNWSPTTLNYPRTFLEGPAGCGKTTLGVQRLVHLLRSGVEASSILVLTPQRTLANPYIEAFKQSDIPGGSNANVLTTSGLARRSIDLFWPTIATQAGFLHPNRPPTFLTLETAQYFMAHLVQPLLNEGYFESVVIDRNRLYSQVLDNLNKAALVDFPHTEIGDRLKAAWVGEISQEHVYSDAQGCANRFRQYCLEHNLLDFSLQVEVFKHYLWPSFLFQAYLKDSFHHLIADNIEEDTPFTHDLLRQWLPELKSALLIYDLDAGYRRFLAADPDNALSLSALCEEHIHLEESTVCPAPLLSFVNQLGQVLEQQITDQITETSSIEAFRKYLNFPEQTPRFYPQMLDWVVEQVSSLMNQGVAPKEVAILAPFLPDALRFSLANRLDVAGIHYRSHRPSRSLRDEPAAQCLITLASLAHPQWDLVPSKFDIAYALIKAIDGLDLVRAQILVEIVYRRGKTPPHLTSFSQIKTDMQERITYAIGNRFEILRTWIDAYSTHPQAELDFFLSRLFGEVLSQPGYGFHADLDAGRVAASLIESVQKFRRSVGEILSTEGIPIGKEYIMMVQNGVIAAQYIQPYQQTSNSVLLTPAYTFLMTNQPIDYQFWLDVGSQAWSERLYQPLTQPYVLSRQWSAGRRWTDADEFETSRMNLYRLALGLVRRCRKKVYLALSDLGEQGYETRSLFLKVAQQVLMQSYRQDNL